MTTQFYPEFRRACLNGEVNLATATVRLALINAAVDPYDATNKYFGDLNAAAVFGNAGGHTRADCPQVTGIITNAGGVSGVIDGADTIIAAPAPPGTVCAAKLLFLDSGADGTSILMAYIDNDVGLPYTFDGHSLYNEWAAASPFIGIL